jgi:hypothetical protein
MSNDRQTLSDWSVTTILYVHAYLWIGQCLYSEYMIYIEYLCLMLLSIIRIGHAIFLSFLDQFHLFLHFCPIITIIDKLVKPANKPETHKPQKNITLIG